MDRGISRVGSSLSAQHAARTSAKKDREREEQADFAEAMEHRDQDSAAESLSPKKDSEAPHVGYPSDDEAGHSLDLKA